MGHLSQTTGYLIALAMGGAYFLTFPISMWLYRQMGRSDSYLYSFIPLSFFWRIGALAALLGVASNTKTLSHLGGDLAVLTIFVGLEVLIGSIAAFCNNDLPKGLEYRMAAKAVRKREKKGIELLPPEELAKIERGAGITPSTELDKRYQ